MPGDQVPVRPGPPPQGIWPGSPSGPQPATALAVPGRAAGVAQPAGPALRAARPALPGLVLAAIGLGAVAVLALWWYDTPVIHGTGDLLTGAGRICGLLSGYGVVVLVAIMARLPPLERGIGSDRLARWHAMGGRYVISLVSGHVVFIIWGYAVTAHEKVTGETVTLLTSYPDVLMATVAWFLLLCVAAFSARAARRRISYETWYYAHLYTYLAIALAFSHQFADGASFVSSLRARVAWSAMYATVAGLIVWYRFLTPLLKAARHRFTVVGVRPEAPGIVSVFITGRDLHKLRAEPGQFFRWRFLTRPLWWQSHPYSLSAMPRPDLMRITVKASGDHSGSLGAALPKRLSDGITLVYRASHPRDVLFSRELEAIAADRGAALHYLIGPRDELGYDPLAPQHLQRLVPGLHRYEAYVCGPPGMTETVIASLRDAGIPRGRVHHESFDF